MSGTSSLYSTVLNEIALARITVAQSGDLIRQKLRNAIVEGPQDAGSVAARIQTTIDQNKITPSVASKLYRTEVGLDDTTDDVRTRTILRHTLRNLASGASGSSSEKVAGAILAADLGYELVPSPDTGEPPPFAWSGSGSKRPLIDLMAHAERTNRDQFPRAVEMAARSFTSGSVNDRMKIAADLEREGFHLGSRVVRFSTSIGAPTKRASSDQAPGDIQKYLTALYAEALATGSTDAFKDYLDKLSTSVRREGIQLKQQVAAANATFRNSVAEIRGKSGLRIAEGTSVASQHTEELSNLIVEFAEESRAISSDANARLEFARYLSKAQMFVRPMDGVQQPPPAQGGGAVAPPVGAAPAGGAPAGAAEPPPPQANQNQLDESLADFYRSLFSPEEVKRLKQEFFLTRAHLYNMPQGYAARAALLIHNEIIGERLLRLADLQDALIGRGPQAIRTALADNAQAIAKARQEGAATAPLKDPTRWNKDKQFHTVRWPVPRRADAPQPPQQPATPEPKGAPLPVAPDSSRVDSMKKKMDDNKAAVGDILKASDQESSRRKQTNLAYALINKARAGASSHGNMREVVRDLDQAVDAEQRSMVDMSKLAMDRAHKEKLLSMALPSMSSNVSAAQLLSIGNVIDKDTKAELIKNLPDAAAMADYVARANVSIGSPSSDAGLNATELYYIINTIMSVKYAQTESGDEPGGFIPPSSSSESKGATESSSVKPQPARVIESVPLAGNTPDAMVQSAEEFILSNAGSIMPAEIVRIIDGDSVVVGVCGIGPDGKQHCVRMHARLASGVSAKEKDETSTQTLSDLLESMVDYSIRLVPPSAKSGVGPTAAYNRWAGVLYGEDRGNVRRVNLELKDMGEKEIGGYNRRYGTKFDDDREEPTDDVVMASLGGAGDRDQLFGANAFEGVIHERPPGNPSVRTEITPPGYRNIKTFGETRDPTSVRMWAAPEGSLMYSVGTSASMTAFDDLPDDAKSKVRTFWEKP